ncbi:phytoene desaturase family protein [Paenibacillus sp. strain BS8-2]
MTMMRYDVAIIGGGMAGLTAAALAAKAGKRVVVIEKQSRLGGRAITNKKDGVYFNLGGHAIYKGAAYDTFRELGCSLKGGQPSIAAHGIWNGKLGVLPTGVGSLLSSPLLTWKGKVEFVGWLAKFSRLDTHRYDGISLREWIEGQIQDPMVRHVFYSLLRTSSYVMAPDLQAAGPVLRSLANALKGVLYVDEGWGAVVADLRDAAGRYGAAFMTGKAAVSVMHQHGAVSGILLDDGSVIEAQHVVIAASPAVSCKLVPGAEQTSLKRWKDQAIEVTAASLDVALRRLPRPKHQLVYGIDTPVFMSNQSRAAKLSDDGSQVVCLMKYQGSESDPERDLSELESALDLAQPGWRAEVVAKQYLPKITVCHDFLHVRDRVNPGPHVPEIDGLYVAGDWVSHGELLVDAATESARRAVQHLLAADAQERNVNHGHRVTV